MDDNLIWYLIALIIFLGYFTIVYGLNKFGVFKKYNISLVLGSIIMWRTTHGIAFLDKLSRKRRFWRWYGNIAIVVCMVGMVIMFLMLAVGAIAVLTLRPEPMPIHHILVLPGINPMIPLWYGIFALAVSIIVHEFAHGILARRAKITMKSLGVLLFIIPIGAFAEPDEKEIENVRRKDRARIFAAGPMTNILFCLIFAGIFSWSFMSSLAPVEDGVIVLDVTKDFSAEAAGIQPGMILTDIEYVDPNGTMVEHVEIKSKSDFSEFLDEREYNDTINVTVYYKDKWYKFDNITLSDRYNYTELEADRGLGFLGVGVHGAEEFTDNLAYPVQSAGDDVYQRRENLINYIFVYPMSSLDPRGGSIKILPFHTPLIEAYEVTGPLGVLPESLFWILANMFYYLFWINLLLGMFNTLPAIPLDGGFVYKDGMNGVLSRLKPNMDAKKRESLINSISFSLAFLVLILILMTFFLPYLFRI